MQNDPAVSCLTCFVMPNCNCPYNHSMEHVSDEYFDALVEAALAEMPPALKEHMDNVAIFVDDDAPADEPSILGVYDGIALTERDSAYGFVPPDTITLFKNNLVNFAHDDADLREQIYITIVHEIAHHYGIDDERLHELGWG